MKTIHITENELREIIKNAWSDGCNTQANRGGYCIYVEKKIIDPQKHPFPDSQRVENRSVIYREREIKKYFK